MGVHRALVLGASGMVGRAISQALLDAGIDTWADTWRGDVRRDLRIPTDCEDIFDEIRPSYVFLAAAKVGGIVANATHPADFIADNLAIGLNVVECCRRHKVEKLINLGSSCIYPRDASQPISESSLLSGPPEPTNRAYAVAKIATIELCDAYRAQHGCNFISAMPCNLYGPWDNFDLESSHVVPALIRRMILAKESDSPFVSLWGDGTPRREFLHVDDAARAILLLAEQYDEPGPINVGAGHDITIGYLAWAVKQAVGYEGEIYWDTTRPTGTPAKLMDSTRIQQMGWTPRIGLDEGLQRVVQWVQGRRLMFTSDPRSLRGWLP